MCGIFGSFDRRLDGADPARALSAMASRGPDGAAIRPLGPDRLFGHTRLSVVDLDQSADQPLAGLGEALWIVFNGEIYNAPALRAQIPDYPWQTDHSDTETILAAYWKWGEAFVEHLRGMFAFALWDGRSASLYLAVDRFSIKPLLWTREGGGLAFASTAAALNALGVPLAPNERAVHSWLADGVLDTGQETFFAGIDQVPAATIARWRDGELSLRRYWTPAETAPRETSVDEIAGWLDEATACHLLADVPVGINLSSGLDSNVLRLRAKASGSPLHAFTFSFPDTVYDEAARVAPIMSDDDPWTVTAIEPEDLWRDLIPLTRSMEMPLGGLAIYGHARNAAAAREAGFKVLFAGEGADEIFSGYKYYAEAAIAEAWNRGERDAASALWQAFAKEDREGWRLGPEALACRRDQTAIARAPDGTALNVGFLSDAFAQTDRLAPPPLPQGEPVRALMWRDLAHMKVPKLLRWQDRAYMASSVEIRLPYLDHPLVERMQQVPIEALLAGGHAKAPLRAIAERLLPSDYFRLPKLYVATPQREWMKRDLHDRIDAWLDPGAALVRRGYVDLERLRSAYRDYCEQPELGNSFFIWKFLALEAMFQGLFEGASA